MSIELFQNPHHQIAVDPAAVFALALLSNGWPFKI